MGKAARVTSIDALKSFKLALAQFTAVANTALGEADAYVRRMTSWVEHEQPSYWKTERRKRTARLAEAKNELFRAQLDAQDQHVSATTERRVVERAEAALEEAETKLRNTKRWSRLLDREVILYRAECQRLAQVLEAECPQALVKLDQMINALERYVKLAAPTMGAETGMKAIPEREEETEPADKRQPPAGGDA